jgi:hypothetical protein
MGGYHRRIGGTAIAVKQQHVSAGGLFSLLAGGVVVFAFLCGKSLAE